MVFTFCQVASEANEDLGSNWFVSIECSNQHDMKLAVMTHVVLDAVC